MQLFHRQDDWKWEQKRGMQHILWIVTERRDMRFKYTSTAKGEREFILILGKVDWYRKKIRCTLWIIGRKSRCTLWKIDRTSRCTLGKMDRTSRCTLWIMDRTSRCTLWKMDRTSGCTLWKIDRTSRCTLQNKIMLA